MATPIQTLRDALYENRDASADKMKEIDRWLFGINSLTFLMQESFSDLADDEACIKATRDWSDNTALRLNEKSTEEAVEVFEKYCTPSYGRALKALAKIEAADVADADQLAGLIEVAQSDQEFFDRVRSECGSGLAAYRKLLPLWIAQGASPLYSMGVWDDADAVQAMSDALCRSFAEAGFHDKVCERFDELVFSTRSSYGAKFDSSSVEDFDLSEDLRGLPLSELSQLMDKEGYAAFPSWLKDKEELIWNFVACSLYGPGNARPQYFANTEFSSGQTSTVQVNPQLRRGMGSAVLCQVREDGARDVVCTISLGSDDSVLQDRLVTVIGREFRGVPTADQAGHEFPQQETAAAHYATLADADSARHLAVMIADGGVVLRDLGSKNGTVVRRNVGDQTLCLCMCGRNQSLLATLAATGQLVQVCDQIPAQRGDQVFLGSSRFEIL